VWPNLHERIVHKAYIQKSRQEHLQMIAFLNLLYVELLWMKEVANFMNAQPIGGTLAPTIHTGDLGPHSISRLFVTPYCKQVQDTRATANWT